MRPSMPFVYIARWLAGDIGVLHNPRRSEPC